MEQNSGPKFVRSTARDDCSELGPIHPSQQKMKRSTLFVYDRFAHVKANDVVVDSTFAIQGKSRRLMIIKEDLWKLRQLGAT